MDSLYNEFLKTVKNIDKYNERELKENYDYWLIDKQKILKTIQLNYH